VSPGLSADSTPVMTISSSAANTTGRHLDDGSRPSGKYSGISTENGIRAGWYTQVCSHNANSAPGSDPGSVTRPAIAYCAAARPTVNAPLVTKKHQPTGFLGRRAINTAPSRADNTALGPSVGSDPDSPLRTASMLAATASVTTPTAPHTPTAILRPVPRSPSHAGRPDAGRPVAVNA